MLCACYPLPRDPHVLRAGGYDGREYLTPAGFPSASLRLGEEAASSDHQTLKLIELYPQAGGTPAVIERLARRAGGRLWPYKLRYRTPQRVQSLLVPGSFQTLHADPTFGPNTQLTYVSPEAALVMGGFDPRDETSEVFYQLSEAVTRCPHDLNLIIPDAYSPATVLDRLHPLLDTMTRMRASRPLQNAALEVVSRHLHTQPICLDPALPALAEGGFDLPAVRRFGVGAAAVDVAVAPPLPIRHPELTDYSVWCFDTVAEGLERLPLTDLCVEYELYQGNVCPEPRVLWAVDRYAPVFGGAPERATAVHHQLRRLAAQFYQAAHRYLHNQLPELAQSNWLQLTLTKTNNEEALIELWTITDARPLYATHFDFALMSFCSKGISWV